MRQYEKNLAYLGGTVTGRFSAKLPEPHKMPRPQMKRELFHEMYGGRAVKADYAELERRIIAIYGVDHDLLP